MKNYEWICNSYESSFSAIDDENIHINDQAMNVFYDELDISHFNQDKIYQSYS
jgi:hypothetical protein